MQVIILEEFQFFNNNSYFLFGYLFIFINHYSCCCCWNNQGSDPLWFRAINIHQHSSIQVHLRKHRDWLVMSSLDHENNTISLQELSKEPLLAIPPHYIQLDQESFSSPSHLMPAIPIVDMETMTLGQAKDFELQKLHSSCKEWGVFQVSTNIYPKSSLLALLGLKFPQIYFFILIYGFFDILNFVCILICLSGLK